MSKISTIVKVRGGYANYVQLRNALREDAENTERMAMYRPTKGHRTALERISRGLFTPNDKKFYLLSGSYGTGKSHLCLMLANLLGTSSDDPSLKGFYDNYTKLDQERAKNLKNVRQGGQYLVALCDYGSGQKFEDAVLKAIVEACEERGISTDKQTEFDEAERLLTEWENSKGTVRDFMGDFTKALATVFPGTPVAALRTGLKNYDRAMMDKFHAAYNAAQGVPFQSKAGNLVAIVKKLVASTEFTAKFKGLAIFFDEFGTAVLQNSKFDPAVMQAFMEEICQQLNNVVFVGCIHKRFQDYAERTNQATASVMSARLTQVDLLNEGIEEIIGAIVETEKTTTEWKTEVLPKAGIFDQLTPQCQTLKLFPWITDTARIRERVLEDIYGMHPMALHCLLKLSSEIGSDARSTFTFFSGGAVTERGSYAEFIEKSDITGPNGALRLYQTAQLFEFFEKEIAPASRELLDSQRALVNGYVASLQALKKSVSAELFDEQRDERVALLQMVLMGTSEAGFVMLGNITLTNESRPLFHTEGLFKELPPALQESAFIDRLHGLLEGWFMPRITKNTPSQMLGFKGDFFGEILHELRPRLEFADYVSHSLRLPSCDDMRDNKAIARIAEGYLKLLFPDLNVTEEQFIEFCVNPALRMRQQIRDELSKIDPEYGWVSIRSSKPDEFQLLHPIEKPLKDETASKVDPLSPDRVAVAATIDIKEGQTGISFRRLFAPYLRGATKITLIDPYLRFEYQITNLMSFIELLTPEDGHSTLEVLTGAGSPEEEVELSEKLDQIQESSDSKKLTFSYRFDRSKHDRMIETDTGWRITLGRGLDIFHRADGRYSLGFIDQTQRKCKETSIVFTLSN